MRESVYLNIQLFYYVIKGYSGQDHVQVEAVIQLAVVTVQDRHPFEKHVSV